MSENAHTEVLDELENAQTITCGREYQRRVSDLSENAHIEYSLGHPQRCVRKHPCRVLYMSENTHIWYCMRTYKKIWIYDAT